MIFSENTRFHISRATAIASALLLLVSVAESADPSKMGEACKDALSGGIAGLVAFALKPGK